MVVDLHSKQRSFLFDTVFGTTLCEFRPGLHVMMQCTCESTLPIVTGYMNNQEDMHRGEPTMEIDKRIKHLLQGRSCVLMERSADAIRIE